MESLKLLKKGGDGKIFAIKNGRILKQFRKNKNLQKIMNEYNMQRRASMSGLAPRVFGLLPDEEGKLGIVMEKMHHTLMDEIRKDNELTEKWQREMIRVLKELDKLKIFHGDVSPINFMIKNGQLYLIDFGMSKEMSPEFISQVGKNANLNVGITSFILKLREFVPNFSPKLLQKYSVFKD